MVTKVRHRLAAADGHRGADLAQAMTLELAELRTLVSVDAVAVVAFLSLLEVAVAACSAGKIVCVRCNLGDTDAVPRIRTAVAILRADCGYRRAALRGYCGPRIA